jgi:hypothetical protein
MNKLEDLLPYGVGCICLLVVLILALAGLRADVETARIGATLLSQGVGANSIRCVLNEDAASCALATHESLASPIEPTPTTTQE